MLWVLMWLYSGFITGLGISLILDAFGIDDMRITCLIGLIMCFINVLYISRITDLKEI